MPVDVGFWMLMGTFVAAVLVFVGGLLVRLSGAKSLRRGSGMSLGGFPMEERARVACGFYNAFDLPMMGFVVLVYSLPLWFQALGGDVGENVIGVEALIGTIVMQLFMATLVLGFVAWRKRPVEWLGLKWARWPLVFAIAPLAVVVTWTVIVAIYGMGLGEWLQGELGEEGLQEAVRVLGESEDPLLLGLLGFTAVVVAPVTEEILFRGYLYPVSKRFIGRWSAILFSSMIFGLAHNNALALVPLFLFAIVLAWSYEWTGSIWAPIGIHMVFNGSTVAMQIAMRHGWEVPT